MLANRVNLVINQIDEFENQVIRENKKIKYKKLMTQLTNSKVKIDNLIELKNILDENIDYISFNPILKNILEIKLSINNDKIDGREGAILNTIIDSIESQLKVEWKKYYEKNTRVILQTLSNIKPFFNDETEIERIILNLKKFESSWPINNLKYNLFIDNINLAKNKIKELELTEDIRIFISKIIANTATIEDLTPNILKWIKDNKYENKIKLRFR
ncbi:hypothetical protein ACSXDQ_03020 [Clostridium perfringens]|uniref:Uncharacterized protein n=1 Tax=Clostridium perfringens TaxID=1502 RepID=A0AAP4A3Q3_CLOPF|nr:hypothetical protein [Clostridium perfringens]MDH2334691.1 hypothetical protein [Clostridium perfringens]